jgi:general secretion pathway protein D
MKTRFRLASAACVTLALATSFFVPDAAALESPRYTLHLIKVDVRRLADEVASATGKTMIVDPRVKNLVTLETQNPVSANELYEAFVRVLYEQGLLVTETRNGVIKITPRTDTLGLTWT